MATYQIKDLPKHMLNEVRQEIRLFSVALLISDRIGSNFIPASGTLCKIEQRYGIITARHVWDHNESGIKRHEELKIVLGQETLTVNTEYLESIEPFVSGTKYNCDVPDIAFIEIRPELRSTIEASRKLFYSLDRSLHEHGNDLFEKMDGYWCIFGSPKARIDDVNRRASSVIYGTSTPFKEEQSEWDYLKLDVIVENEQMPEDAKGMSGGGIWRTRFLPDFSKYQAIFSGVSFYQTDVVNSKYQIIGHGPQSVYKNLLEFVREIKGN